MFRTMLAILAGALAFPAAVLAQASPIQMSVLPNARAGVVDADITFFATIVNTSETEANSCRHTGFDRPNGLPAGVTGTVEVFALDESRNIEGSANSFFTIPAGGRRDLLVAFDIDAPMSGTLSLSMRCQFATNEFRFAPTYEGVNDFQLTVRAAAGPDIVMIGDTLSGDGVMRVGSAPRTGLFVISAINIGAEGSGLVVAPSYLGYSSLNNLTTEICETNASGICTTPRGATVTVDNWANGQVRTFAAFFRQAQYTGISFFPDVVRAAVEIGTPAAASGDLSRPAINTHDLIDTVRTTTAVDAAAQLEAYAAVANTFALVTHGSFQCTTQVQFGLGNVANRFGGFMAIAGNSSPANTARGEGYLRLFPTPQPGGGIPSSYLQPVTIDIPDRTATIQNTTATVYGQGQGTPVALDQVINGTMRYSALRFFIFEQDGSASFDNDLDYATRTRCIPAPPPSANPPSVNPVDALSGTFDILDPVSQIVAGTATVRASSQPEVAEVSSSTQPLSFKFVNFILDESETAESLSIPELFMAWFATGASEGIDVKIAERRSGLVIPPPLPTLPAGRVDCAVVVDYDSDRASAEDPASNDDASVELWRRTEVDLNEGECVL